MKKLSLRKEHLTELTAAQMRGLVAGAPRDGGTISANSCSVCIEFVPGGLHCNISKNSCSVCIDTIGITIQTED